VADLDVHGQRVFHTRRGEGEPLLLIQGLSGNHLHWTEPFLDLLARDFDVIAYDHRGIGRSAPAEAGYSIADLADDAAGVLDALDIAGAHVLGISMGGMVAQELALRHPHVVRTLVLGCTSPGSRSAARTDPAIVSRLTELFLSGRVGEAMAEGYAFNVSEAFARDPAGFERMKAIAAELPVALPVMLAQLQAIAGHDTLDRLGAIDVPVLVVHGIEDRILPVANAHLIAGAIAQARLEIFDGVGHLFWWEHPERSAELVRELAAGVGAAQ
jgi:3-oxoadipate enol-lactonase